MFVDRTFLHLLAGKGGDGVVAFRREKFLPKGGPYGGDGGRGGSIVFRSSSHPFSLETFRNLRVVKAENGKNGGANHCTGKSGATIFFDVPLGTVLKDSTTGDILHDFTQPDQEYTACKGGRGGKGNSHFKSPTNRTPDQHTLGTKGEEKEIILELKFLADIGLVGLPNAGKSTLIGAITPVKAKIGAYPFTTLDPNLGQITFSSGEKRCIADIPGIIEGAHENKGLGLSFLRHIERTKLLIFVIDLFSATFLEDLSTLRKELKEHDPALLKKPSLVVLNKIDLPGKEQLLEEFYKRYPQETPLLISAKETTGIKELRDSLEKLTLEASFQDEEERSHPEEKILLLQ